MSERSYQENNGSPRGYGQPKKAVNRRVILDDRAEQIGQMADGPVSEESPKSDWRTQLGQQGGGFNGGHVARYGMEPQAQQVDPNWQEKRMRQPQMQPVGGSQPVDAYGQNQYAQQAYQNAGSPMNQVVADVRNAMSTPGDPSMVAQWMQRNGGVNPQQGSQQPQMASGLHDAFKQSIANGYTDIQDTNPWQTGQFMGQLQGFNTNGWGTGERGSGTLKNRFGQIASRYDVSQQGALKALMQDPQFMEMTGGQATMVDHPKQDLIDFDGPNGPMAPIDVIGNAVEGGAGQNWWWGPTDEQGGGPQAPANQMYNQAIQPMPQPGDAQGQADLGQMDQGQAMEFLQWLMQQQQGGGQYSPFV